MAIASIASAAAAAAGKKLITELTSGLLDSVLQHSAKYKQQRFAQHRIANLYKRISDLRNVKTILNVDKEVDLHSFYVPTKIFHQGKSITINDINDLPEKGNVVIEGMVGMGKSIFLRYIGSRALQTGDKIPIYIEFRHYSSNENIQNLISSRLNRFSMPHDTAVIDYLMNSGRCLFLCDAFDEATESSHQSIIAELESLIERYPKSRFIVTSRPDTAVQRSSKFRIIKISDFTNADIKQVITKLTENDRDSRLLADLAKLQKNVLRVIKSPLMATLLVISYKSNYRLPETVNEFYDNLFSTLARRHDDTKPGYIRNRKSGLTDSEFRKCFEAFCLLSKNDNRSVFSKAQIINYAQKAIKLCMLDSKSDAFIDDLKRITCLVLEEGRQFQFVHKSVQEYYCSFYLKDIDEDRAKMFYFSCANRGFAKWTVELNTLIHIDRYRMTKFFLKPLYKQFLDTYFPNFESDPLDNSNCDSLISSLRIVTTKFPATLNNDGHGPDSSMTISSNQAAIVLPKLFGWLNCNGDSHLLAELLQRHILPRVWTDIVFYYPCFTDSIAATYVNNRQQNVEFIQHPLSDTTNIASSLLKIVKHIYSSYIAYENYLQDYESRLAAIDFL